MTIATVRTPEEIERMHEEFDRRLWFRRSLQIALSGRDSPEAMTARQNVAREYPVVLDDIANPTGWMSGALQALRWVLGEGERVEGGSADT